MALLAALTLSGPPAARADGASSPEAGPREGIRVHGDWTIEIRNPDGSLASRHEFRNALVPEGAHLLTRVLSVENVVDNWLIVLDVFGGTGGPRPCIREGAGSACLIVTPTDGAFGPATSNFGNLVVSVPASGPNAGWLVLSGTATATNPEASQIQFVNTTLQTCPSPLTAPCPAARQSQVFTHRVLSPAIQVAPGQLVQVTVVISFS